tara:strand:- start:1352 stop:1759 length:408 start_codon:yes stop_codon:yes gene_type:complete
MAQINLVFNHEINVSVQIGDIVYFIQTNPVGNPRVWEQTTTPHMTADRENIIMIGPVLNILPWNGLTTVIIADYDDIIAAQYGPPPRDSFIMFSKDNKVNLSSLLGYYSLAKVRNNSTEKSEMFSIATDFVESSK